jgi:hypothetical protein
MPSLTVSAKPTNGESVFWRVSNGELDRTSPSTRDARGDDVEAMTSPVSIAALSEAMFEHGPDHLLQISRFVFLILEACLIHVVALC